MHLPFYLHSLGNIACQSLLLEVVLGTIFGNNILTIHACSSSVDGKSDSLADGHQSDKKLKKKKKKKTKSQEDCMVNMDLPVLQENEMNRQSVNIEDKSLKVKSTVIRTLSNGLTIEELAVGAPGGKLAAPGKKVI